MSVVAHPAGAYLTAAKSSTPTFVSTIDKRGPF
jgi:hypothetical protein